MSGALLGQVLLTIVGLTAAGGLAWLVRLAWRRDPLASYRLLVVILLGCLALPIAQVVVQGRASHWLPESTPRLFAEPESTSEAIPVTESIAPPIEAQRLASSPVVGAAAPSASRETSRRVDPGQRSRAARPSRRHRVSRRFESMRKDDRIAPQETGSALVAELPLVFSNANGPITSTASAGPESISHGPERPDSSEAGARESEWGPLVVGPFAILYLVGLALVAVGYLIRTVRTSRLVRSCRPVSDAEVLAIWRRVSRGSRLRRRVSLLTGDRITSPACCGVRRPVLLVPAGPVSDAATLEWALRHELVHLERGDARIAVLQAVLTTIAWFHPVSWWISRQLDRLRELSCDLLVVLKSGRRRSYALALLSYADGPAPTPTGALGPRLLQWSRSPSQLRRRIEMLAHRESVPSRRHRWGRALAVACAFLGAWATQIALAATMIPGKAPSAVEASTETTPELNAPETEASTAPVRASTSSLSRLITWANTAAMASMRIGDDAPAGVLPFEELGEAWSDLDEPIQLAGLEKLLNDEPSRLRPVDALEKLPWLVHVETPQGVLKVSIQSGELLVTIDGRPVAHNRVELKPNRVIVRLEDGSVGFEAPLPVVGLTAATNLDRYLGTHELDRGRLSKLQRDAWRRVNQRLREAQRRAQRQQMDLQRRQAQLARRWSERQAELRLEERRLSREWTRQHRDLDRLIEEFQARHEHGEGQSAQQEENARRLEEELSSLRESWDRFDHHWDERLGDWQDQLEDVDDHRQDWIESFERLADSLERDLEDSFDALDHDFEALRDSFREQLEQGDLLDTGPRFQEAWQRAFERLIPPFEELSGELLDDFDSYREALDEDVAEYDNWLEAYRDQRSEDLHALMASWHRTLALYQPGIREILDRHPEDLGDHDWHEIEIENLLDDFEIDESWSEAFELLDDDCEERDESCDDEEEVEEDCVEEADEAQPKPGKEIGRRAERRSTDTSRLARARSAARASSSARSTASLEARDRIRRQNRNVRED